MVSDKKGKTITGWDISIKPGQTYERKGDGFQPGKEYKLIYASASITNNRECCLCVSALMRKYIYVYVRFRHFLCVQEPRYLCIRDLEAEGTARV
eukprot:1358203-Amorphochlora_amoeboformis.AAC.1